MGHGMVLLCCRAHGRVPASRNRGQNIKHRVPRSPQNLVLGDSPAADPPGSNDARFARRWTLASAFVTPLHPRPQFSVPSSSFWNPDCLLRGCAQARLLPRCHACLQHPVPASLVTRLAHAAHWRWGGPMARPGWAPGSFPRLSLPEPEGADGVKRSERRADNHPAHRQIPVRCPPVSGLVGGWSPVCFLF